jgi:hypothetical protein
MGKGIKFRGNIAGNTDERVFITIKNIMPRSTERIHADLYA